MHTEDCRLTTIQIEKQGNTTPPDSNDDNIPIVKTIIDAKRQSNFVGMKVTRDFGKTAVSGKLKFKGNAIKHKKGEPYLVDCNVTGSDVGTATKPCYPLLNLWKYTLVPAIAQLLAPGAPCEGAQVIVQQDNAGPHIEEVYSA